MFHDQLGSSGNWFPAQSKIFHTRSKDKAYHWICRLSALRMDWNKFVRFEVSTAVTMKIIIFWEMTPCGSYKSHTVSFPWNKFILAASINQDFPL
jgi:hypothetical protein